MIDLHSHILPGIDDGSASDDISLAMARASVADGVTDMACTPHVMPGLYDNSLAQITVAVQRLRAVLAQAGVPLRLHVGADVHLAPGLQDRLRRTVPTLAGTRYFLLEPPHHILPPQLEAFATAYVAAGFVPIITHPERLTWIGKRYDVLERLNASGCLVQVTAGAITGEFGRTAQGLAERLLGEGRVDIIASDTHDPVRRAPGLSKARERVAALCGADEAEAMVLRRPARILLDELFAPVGLRRGRSSPGPGAPPTRPPGKPGRPPGLFSGWLGRNR